MEPKECPTFSTEMDEALCFLEPSRANVKFTISLNQDANHQAVSPTRLQNPKDRNNASRRIGATYVPSFSPKAPWGQSCDLLLVFGKSHCNQQFFQGNYHMAPSVLPFGKGFSQPLQVQHIHHSHIISIVVAQKAKNLPTVKLVTFMACQVYQIATRTQAILDPSMVAAADITPAVPNLCSYKNQFPDHRLCLQQPRLSCKHIKI